MKFKIINNKLVTTIALIALIFIQPLIPLLQLKADPIADPNDVFEVLTPLPNQKVSGSIQVKWKMFDDEQVVIPYQAQIFDAATCKDNDLGRINPNSNGISSRDQDNTLGWNTHSTESGTNLPDGKYCLRICAAFAQNNDIYSACNSRIINIVNNNKLPTITSVPSPLSVNQSQTWQYQIKATDPDNDSLHYLLLYAPDFLEIDSKGLVNAKPANRLPANVNQANYRVVVGVDDGVSGITTQEFTLKITKGGSGTGQPNLPPVITNTNSEISFISPTETTIFKGTNNKVEWNAYDPDGISEVRLSYSNDGSNWNNLMSTGDPKSSSFNWDVTTLQAGTYYLQLTVKDMKGVSISKTSKLFQIQKEEIIVSNSSPLIINVKPENQKELASLSEITGQFAPSKGEIIEPTTFSIKFDDNDISKDCEVKTTDFKCSAPAQISQGVHKLNLIIKDKSGHDGSLESQFTYKVDTPISFAEGFNFLGFTISNSLLTILLIILCLVLLLLLIPWILFSIWSGRSHKKVTETTETITEDQPLDFTKLESFSQSYQQPNPLPNVSVNYYNPETSLKSSEPVVVNKTTTTETKKTGGVLTMETNIENPVKTEPQKVEKVVETKTITKTSEPSKVTAGIRNIFAKAKESVANIVKKEEPVAQKDVFVEPKEADYLDTTAFESQNKPVITEVKQTTTYIKPAEVKPIDIEQAYSSSTTASITPTEVYSPPPVVKPVEVVQPYVPPTPIIEPSPIAEPYVPPAEPYVPPFETAPIIPTAVPTEPAPPVQPTAKAEEINPDDFLNYDFHLNEPKKDEEKK